MEYCHVCHKPIPNHDCDCRVSDSLDRFERVWRRLAAERREPVLQASLIRQLGRHGRPVA